MNSEHMNALGEYPMKRCQARVTMQVSKFKNKAIEEKGISGGG